jgi:hypothetical protein
MFASDRTAPGLRTVRTTPGSDVNLDVQCLVP